MTRKMALRAVANKRALEGRRRAKAMSARMMFEAQMNLAMTESFIKSTFAPPPFRMVFPS